MVTFSAQSAKEDWPGNRDAAFRLSSARMRTALKFCTHPCPHRERDKHVLNPPDDDWAMEGDGARAGDGGGDDSGECVMQLPKLLALLVSNIA